MDIEKEIEVVDILDEAECAVAYGTVRKLKDNWLQRHPALPFFTLGAANYFDITGGPGSPYYTMIRTINPVLWENFQWVYERLAERLGSHLGAPVVYRDGLALPGFHIFDYHPAFTRPRDVTHAELFRNGYPADQFCNPIHCDKAHLLVDWGDTADLDLEHPISFTMVVAMPESGAGLYLWDFHYEETKNLPAGSGMEVLGPILDSRQRHTHHYQKGKMAVHSGLYLHQPMPAGAIHPGCDSRVTLQGHGIFGSGAWHLFW